MPRKKNNIVVAIATVAAFEEVLNQYIDKSLDLATRKATHESVIASLNADFERDTEQLRGEVALTENSLALFAQERKTELFEQGKKSREFTNAIIGHRDNPPSVGKRLTKDTWEAIAARLDQLAWGEPYVETKLAVRKDDLLRDRANLTDSQLVQAGIKFEQSETFFIKPKADSIDRVAVESAA